MRKLAAVLVALLMTEAVGAFSGTVGHTTITAEAFALPDVAADRRRLQTEGQPQSGVPQTTFLRYSSAVNKH